MKVFNWGVLFFCGALLLSTECVASGFALNDQGPRGTSRAGAFVAQADDATALWYNPAGITQITSTQAAAGFLAYKCEGKIEFDGIGIQELDNEAATTPFIYGVTRLGERTWGGVGLFVPFGMASGYDEEWLGRYNTYYSGTYSLELNPSLAYKLTDRLSVAGGLSLQFFEVRLKQKIDPEVAFVRSAVAGGADPAVAQAQAVALGLDAAPDIDQDLRGKNIAGARFNLAFHWAATDTLSFGANYRSELTHDISGDVEYHTVPAVLGTGIYSTGFNSEITLPQSVWAGVAYRPMPDLVIEADVTWTGWSSFENLTVAIDNSIGTTRVDKSWDDVFCYRIGAEYDLSDSLSLRLGYLYDESPIPDHTIDYATPDGDRHGFFSGVGYTFGRWQLDASYSLVMLKNSVRIEARPEEGILYSGASTDNYIQVLGLSLSCAF